MLSLQRYGDHHGQAPLVIVHGFLCAGLIFRPNIEILQRRYNLITVDLPGFGGSHAVAAAGSIAAMARQVQEALAAAGCTAYHLLGHSMGGMVALQLALTAAAQIQTLIIYAGNSSGNLPERFETFAESKQRLRRDFTAAKRHVCTTWLTAGADNPHFHLLQQSSDIVAPATADKAIDAMAAFDVSACIGGIRQPTLIISAELDKTYSPRCQRDLCASIPQARQRLIKNCAHCAHLEDAAAFNQIVSDWLESC